MLLISVDCACEILSRGVLSYFSIGFSYEHCGPNRRPLIVGMTRVVL